MPEWLKSLIDRGASLIRKEVPYISWSEVIQLDPLLDHYPARKDLIVGELIRWQNTKAGQKAFAELKDAQSRIPDNHRWELKEDRRIPERDRKAFNDELADIEARHTEPKKLFLYATATRKEDASVFDAYSNSKYKLQNHMLVINLATLDWEASKVPKLVDGKKTFAAQPLRETLQHETRHGIDWLNKKFGGKTPNIIKPRNRECLETRAVEAEQELQAEESSPKRYAYEDIALSLARLVAKDAPATPAAYAKLRQELVERASFDIVGCKLEGLTGPALEKAQDALREQSNKAADDALKAHGVHIVPDNAPSAPLPPAAPSKAPTAKPR